MKSSKFLTHVRTLATGTLLAQILSLAASPLTTRLYPPESFAILATLTTIAATASSVTGARYDLAAAVAREERERLPLLVLAAISATICSMLLMCLFLLGEQSLKELLGAEPLGKYWLLIPLIILGMAMIQAGKYFLSGINAYRQISTAAIIHSAIGVSVTVILGLMGSDEAGLVVGLVSATTVSCCYFCIVALPLIRTLAPTSCKDLLDAAERYRQFPLFNATSSLLDSVTVALPVIYIGRYYEPDVLGYYALLLRVANVPLSFISQSVAIVHTRRIAEKISTGESLWKYQAKVTWLLGGIALLVSSPIVYAGDRLFGFVFGAEWARAGVLAAILMPALAFRFVVSTVSGVFSATGNNALAASWKVIAFTATLTVLEASAGAATIESLLWKLVYLDYLLYGVYYALIWYAVKNPKNLSAGA